MFLCYLLYFVLSYWRVQWNTADSYIVTVKRFIGNGIYVVPPVIITELDVSSLIFFYKNNKPNGSIHINITNIIKKSSRIQPKLQHIV